MDDKPSGQGNFTFLHGGAQAGEYIASEIGTTNAPQQKLVWHGGDFSINAN